MLSLQLTLNVTLGPAAHTAATYLIMVHAICLMVPFSEMASLEDTLNML